MVEAFYHMKDIPDTAYDSYTATLEELRNRKYKGRVNRENRNHDYSKFATTKEECTTVIKQNIDKAWLLSETERVVNGIAQILPDSSTILKAQLKKMEAYRKEIIDIFVNSVYLYDDHLVFTYNFKDGTQTLTLQEIESALCSDLTSSASPKEKNLQSERIAGFFLYLQRFSPF